LVDNLEIAWHPGHSRVGPRCIQNRGITAMAGGTADLFRTMGGRESLHAAMAGKAALRMTLKLR